MAHLAAVPGPIDGKVTDMLFIDLVFRQHGFTLAIIFDREPRFTGKVWTSIFKVLGTSLGKSTVDYPPTDGQTELVNRVVDDVLRSVCAESPETWNSMLPVIELCEQHCSFPYPLYFILCKYPQTPGRSAHVTTTWFWAWWGKVC